MPMDEHESTRKPPPMTPERWRAVDAILRGALGLEPGQRDAFVRDACGDDEELRREVASLLAAHDAMTGDFLERRAVPTDGQQLLSAALSSRYEVERELARGGMATVYLARDIRHERLVAIKVMRDEVAAAVGAERFLEEIRVTALLQHPHILPLFDSGKAGKLLWYAMPYVTGETLRTRLTREVRLPVDEAVRIAREVAEALEHAHARGILHRDVKPENILLEEGHAVVADFGIALALEHAGGERLTRTGLTLGTPQYMSPEQAAGERALDARADVYALGAMLYEMLTGQPPFVAESRQAVLQQMLTEPPKPLATRGVAVAPSLDSAVQRAMAKRAAERFPSAAAFAAALVTPQEPNGAVPAKAAARTALRSDTSAPARRMVTVRAATFAGLAGIALGVTGGFGLAGSSIASGWWGTAAAPVIASSDAAASTQAMRGAWVGGARDALSLVVVDRAGRVQQQIQANRPWTPRFSPDGRRVAYGAFGPGRGTSDIWVADLEAKTTRRVTDDDADSNDPQWSPDGAILAYSVSADGGKDVAERRVDGGAARVIAARPGTQFPSDWLRDGSAFIVTDDFGPNGHDVVVQPADGSPPRAYVATSADETAARVSPDGHWIAYTSNASGKPEVYLDSYPWPTRRVLVSHGGGLDPVWRGDGRELYYWRGDSLVAVQLGATKGEQPPPIGDESVLFRSAYEAALNTMYDVSADGQRFVIVRRG